MERVIDCDCGFVVRGSSEDQLVAVAQEHAHDTYGIGRGRQSLQEIARSGLAEPGWNERSHARKPSAANRGEERP